MIDISTYHQKLEVLKEYMAEKLTGGWWGSEQWIGLQVLGVSLWHSASNPNSLKDHSQIIPTPTFEEYYSQKIKTEQ